MKLKKISEEHYIIVDDSEIKEGDWIGFPNLKKFVPVQYFGGDLTGGEKKITYSTQPLGWLNEYGFTTANLKPDWTNVKPLPLSEVKELFGVVDVEKKALEMSPIELDEDWDKNKQYRDEWISGYNQALEDNKEKKWTDEDVIKIVEKSRQTGLTAEYLMLSLQPKTEWEVEMVDGKLKLKQ